MIIYIFTFSLCFVPTLLFGKTYTKNYDRNQNGRDDLFKYYHNKTLIRVSEDRNEDKSIDYMVVFNDLNYNQVEFQDTNFDGKFDRKKSYFSSHKMSNYVIYELDKNHDGKFEIKFKERVQLNQNKIECYQGFVNNTIERLSDIGLDIASYNTNDRLLTNFGYEIDRQCLKKWGNSFTENLKKSMTKGLSCLNRLHDNQDKNNISGALRNAFDLSRMLKRNNISITCSEKDYYWGGVAAHASYKKDDKIKKLSIAHPYISINTHYPKIFGEPSVNEVENLKSTLFHEQLHNLGFKHGVDIEFAYACETCCMEKTFPGQKKIACKICTGNYQNETDIEYIKDIVKYTLNKNDGLRGAKSVLLYLKENPKSIIGISYLAKAYSEKFNTLGPELSQIILERSSKVNSVVSSRLKKILHNKSYTDLLPLKASARTIASAIYEVYYNNKKSRALYILENNIEILKSELDVENTKDYYKQKVGNNLKSVLKNLLYEIQKEDINKKSNLSEKKIQRRAFKLMISI